MGPVAYIVWISLLVVTQIVLALWGILSRYLQTKPNEPAPALRLVLIISTLAETTLLLFHTLPTTSIKYCQKHIEPAEDNSSKDSYSVQPPGLFSKTMRASSTAEADANNNAGSAESDSVAAVHDAAAAEKTDELLGAQQLAESELHVWQSAAAAAIVSAGYTNTIAPLPCCQRYHHEQQEAQSPTGDEILVSGTRLNQKSNQLEALQLSPCDGAVAAEAEAKCLERAEQAQADDGARGAPLSSPSSSHNTSHHSQGTAVACSIELPEAASLPPQEQSHCTVGSRYSLQGAKSKQSSWGGFTTFSSRRGSLWRLKTAVRPEVPLKRGLSQHFLQMHHSRPTLTRYLALATLTVSFSATCGLQLCAPGFVDPSLVQLVGQFTAIGTALAQAMLLGHRLPRSIWPCALLMTGGAAMVIVPSLGQNEVGSLGTARGWLGFGLAVIALVATVVYFITLQACRHLGYSATHLQHYFLTFSAFTFLVLSLPIDGTEWKEQFKGWTAGDWLILAFESSIAYVGSAAVMQHCVWKLGAPMVSMFMGLRLVFTAALAEPILGASVIKTGVQIAGIVLTAGSVTVYVGLQWWQSRKANLKS